MYSMLIAVFLRIKYCLSIQLTKEDDMPQSTTSITFVPNSYEHVGRRIQKMVSDPKVQKHQAVNITRRPEEAPEAWERVIQELDETDGITVERLDDQSVRIGWKRFIES